MAGSLLCQVWRTVHVGCSTCTLKGEGITRFHNSKTHVGGLEGGWAINANVGKAPILIFKPLLLPVFIKITTS